MIAPLSSLPVSRTTAIFQKSLGNRKTKVFGDMEELISQQLKDTLKKAPRKRTKAEINVIASVANIAFFQDFRKEYGEDKLHDLLRTSYFEYL